MQEWIIEDCTTEEICRLEQSDIDWYPDDLMTSDVCVYGTIDDVNRAMEIIGRRNRE